LRHSAPPDPEKVSYVLELAMALSPGAPYLSMFALDIQNRKGATGLQKAAFRFASFCSLPGQPI
jgi:hypothetical protein